MLPVWMCNWISEKYSDCGVGSGATFSIGLWYWSLSTVMGEFIFHLCKVPHSCHLSFVLTNVARLCNLWYNGINLYATVYDLAEGCCDTYNDTLLWCKGSFSGWCNTGCLFLEKCPGFVNMNHIMIVRNYLGHLIWDICLKITKI